MKVARVITIYVVPNGFDVHEGEGFSGPLSWDEMLGQIASMTIPSRATTGNGLFGMKTPDQWDEQRARWRKRWMPTPYGLPEPALDSLRMLAREFGRRGGEFDELLPIEQQDDERVRLAMRLIELSKEPANA